MIADGGSSLSSITSWGPIAVGAAGLITAIVGLLSRRDKRESDQDVDTTTRINTALSGLSAVVDRTEQERARWQQRAEKAEARVEELEEENDRLERALRAKPPPVRTPVKRPAKRSVPIRKPKKRPVD